MTEKQWFALKGVIGFWIVLIVVAIHFLLFFILAEKLRFLSVWIFIVLMSLYSWLIYKRTLKALDDNNDPRY